MEIGEQPVRGFSKILTSTVSGRIGVVGRVPALPRVASCCASLLASRFARLFALGDCVWFSRRA
jgi:hypothetical protein